MQAAVNRLDSEGRRHGAWETPGAPMENSDVYQLEFEPYLNIYLAY